MTDKFKSEMSWEKKPSIHRGFSQVLACFFSLNRGWKYSFQFQRQLDQQNNKKHLCLVCKEGKISFTFSRTFNKNCFFGCLS